MTQFVDINERPIYADSLPSVAMHYGAYYIEDRLEGYRTLNVSGREVLGYDIKTLGDSDDITGTIISSKSLPARELEIEYQLVADNNEQFQERFRQLVYLLDTTTGDIPIYFRDDPTIEYFGQLGRMDDIPPNTNSVIGKFTVYCQDPIKYTRVPYVSDYASSITLPNDDVLSYYSIVPDSIRIRSSTTFNLAGQIITVTNETTGRKIVLDLTHATGTISSSRYLGIDIKNNEIFIRSNTTNNILEDINYVRYLAFQSTDFHKFTVRPNHTISVEPTGLQLSVVARGEYK